MSGIDQPGVLDLVTRDDVTGEFALVLSANAPWNDTETQLSNLLQKLNSYYVFAVDGGLTEAYPESAGQPVRIQLDCVEPPTPDVHTVVAQIEPRLAEHNIRFLVNVLDQGADGSA